MELGQAHVQGTTASGPKAQDEWAPEALGAVGLEPLVGCGRRAPPRRGALLPSFRTRFFSPGNVKKLGETYPKISNAQNAELRLRWGQIVLKNDHREDFWKVREFLRSQVGAPDSLSPPAPGTRRAGPCGPPLWGKGPGRFREQAVVPPCGETARPVHLCRSAGEAQGEGLLSVERTLGGRQDGSCVSWASLGERPAARSKAS